MRPSARRLGMSSFGPACVVCLALMVDLVAVGGGCNTDTDTSTTIVPTSVAVDPLDFLGSVPCSTDAGAARSYRATVTDLTTGAILATSPAVSCTQPVGFEGVVESHAYAADILVFTDPAGETSAQWTTSCAKDGTGAAVATVDQRIFIHNCIPLTGPGGGTTGVAVDATALAASIGCLGGDGGAGGSGGAGGGAGTTTSSSSSASTSSASTSSASTSSASTSSASTSTASSSSASSASSSSSSSATTGAGGGTDGPRIAKLTVVPDDAALPTTTIGCGQAPVVYETGVVPGKVYGFLVEAFEEGATDHRWAARCTASSIDGVTTLAACQALSEYGTIRVDLAQILADSLLTCDPTVLEEASSIDVTFDEGTTPVTATGLACDHDPVVGPFSRGSHGGEVTLRGQGGSLRGHAICFASVEPAVQALATCVAD